MQGDNASTQQSSDGLRDTSGEVLRSIDLAGLTISEDVYATSFTLGKHHHRHAYLTYVIDGSYTEIHAGGSELCGPGTLRFLPAGETHENRFEAGFRCLHVKLEESFLERVREHTPVLKRPSGINGLPSTLLANRLYAEFRQRDTVAPLAI